MKKVLKVTGIIILFLLVFGIIGTLLGSRIVTTNYEIETDKIDEDFRIVQISDYHSMAKEEDRATVLEKTTEADPDIIVISGDYTTKEDIRNDLQMLDDLTAIAPVYYSRGNHDNRFGNVEPLYAYMDEAGVTHLADESITIDNNINIIGLNDTDAVMEDTVVEEDNINTVVPPLVEEDMFNLVIAHNPAYYESYCNAGADLVLSGHVHGGQWQLPFTNISLIGPEGNFLPKYDVGQFDESGCTMIISSGLNNDESHHVPRLYNPQEVVVIDLISTNK